MTTVGEHAFDDPSTIGRSRVSSNAVVLLQGLLAKSREQTRAQLSSADHNTYWVAEQYLKTTGITPEELIGGIVDGEKDCGLDAVYVFANGIAVSDDTPIANLGRRPRLELILLQVKDSRGFGEDAIDKLIVALPRLLMFDRDERAISSFANSRVIETTRRFLNAYKTLDLPDLEIFTVFASLKADQVHPGTVDKGTHLQTTCSSLFGNCPMHVSFLEAPSLYEMARETKNTSRSLQLSENPISTDMAGGYVGVVGLDSYREFITVDGELDTSLFEANVRDYEGDSAVNRSIESTLASADAEVDFWWLNNGVIIVATEVQLAHKLLKLESPQIVNGLQTSTEIYNRGRTSDPSGDSRSVLVKIIQANDPAVRERIIRATNSQTAFGPSALRATDKVQRQIEDYLLTKGYFYERRRRQYYNEGRPMDKIVSIDGMGQALMSILLQAPHVARATPSRVFDPEFYDTAFDLQYPVQMYSTVMDLMRQSDQFLRDRRVGGPEDFRFHLAMLSSIALTRKVVPEPSDIVKLSERPVPDMVFATQYSLLQNHYAQRSRISQNYLLDQLAKDGGVTKSLLAEAAKALGGSARRS